MTEIYIIREILAHYEIAFGQVINFKEYSISFGLNVHEKFHVSIQQALQLESKHSHDCYLVFLPLLVVVEEKLFYECERKRERESERASKREKL